MKCLCKLLNFDEVFLIFLWFSPNFFFSRHFTMFLVDFVLLFSYDFYVLFNVTFFSIAFSTHCIIDLFLWLSSFERGAFDHSDKVFWTQYLDPMHSNYDCKHPYPPVTCICPIFWPCAFFLIFFLYKLKSGNCSGQILWNQ